jgi:hypothetical protein
MTKEFSLSEPAQRLATLPYTGLPEDPGLVRTRSGQAAAILALAGMAALARLRGFEPR